MASKQLALIAVIAMAASITHSHGREKHKPRPEPAKATCARGAYPGDPVCFGEDDARTLPMPSTSASRPDVQPGVRVNDDVTVQGRSDMTLSKKMPVYLNNPDPSPHSQDVSGGAAVNYRF
jgi:hypothetical protein